MRKLLATAWSLLFMFSIVIVLIILLSIFLNVNFLWMLLGFEVVAFVACLIVGFGKRRLDVKIRWIMFLIFVPIVGVFSYIFFGRAYPNKVKKIYEYKNFKTINKTIENEIVEKADEKLVNTPQYHRSFAISKNQQGDLPFSNSKAQLFNNAALAWIKIMDDINNAKEYILINYYIIEDGDLYRNVKQLLKKKIGQGIRVYIIFDFVGCYGKFTYKEQWKLKSEGFNIVPYMELHLPFVNWKSDYRDHRKDISIDGKIGYIGGSNLGDEYINKSPKYGLWHDAQIRITGQAVNGIEKIFASDWKFCIHQDITKKEPLVGKLHNVEIDDNEIIQLDASGPNHKYPGNLDILMNIIATAQKRVWLSTPYFVPPVELINQIASTARSGVDVRLVLPGITDKFLLLDVSKKHTDTLFDAGVKIYTMDKVFNHTKGYLIDDDLAFIGSTNLDYRALFSDQQTMGLIYSKKFNHKLSQRFENDFRVSHKYESKPSKEHNIFIRFFILLFNWAAPLL